MDLLVLCTYIYNIHKSTVKNMFMRRRFKQCTYYHYILSYYYTLSFVHYELYSFAFILKYIICNNIFAVTNDLTPRLDLDFTGLHLEALSQVQTD